MIGDPVNESLRDGHELGVPAFGIVSVEPGLLAEVLAAAQAEPALAAGRAQPGRSDPLAGGEPPRALPCLLYGADDFVPRHNGEPVRLELARDDVEVRMADPATSNPDENIAGTGLRNREILQLKRGLLDGLDSPEDHGPHRGGLPTGPLAILPLMRAMRFSKSFSVARALPLDRARPSVATRMASG